MSNHTVSAEGGAMAAEGHKTRRAALRALAGAMALAIPTISAIADAPSDPIFVASATRPPGELSRHCFPPSTLRRPCEWGREVTQADLDAYERARALEDQSLDELLTTPPTTFAGMRSAIEYLVSFEDGSLSDTVRPFLVTLLKSPLFADLRSNA